MAEQQYNFSLSNRGELQTIKHQLKLTEEELKHTQHELQKTTQSLEDVRQAMEAGLQAKEQEIDDIKKDLLQLKESLAVQGKEITENEEKLKEAVAARFEKLEHKIDKLVSLQYHTVQKSPATWSTLLNVLAAASESGKQVLPIIVRMDGFIASKNTAVVNNW